MKLAAPGFDTGLKPLGGPKRGGVTPLANASSQMRQAACRYGFGTRALALQLIVTVVRPSD
jgi:hypothetical protein